MSGTLNTVLPSRESVVSGAPFLAALLAPAATLFDIPALSQRWYSFEGQELSDPPASLVLSAISLAFSILANTLLVVRFAIDNPRRWRMAIRISLMSWFLKTAVGFANLIVFGATRRNGPGYVYIEGFWCAIVSVILSGIVTVLLSAQYMLNTHDRPEGSVNLDCRMLIISEMILFGVTALEALIFCKVEGWTYLDGLYFAVVSLLTIGFGNLVPTKTSTKILLFPFSIMGIALLSNQVTLIASVSSRMTQRYRQRLNYGPALHRKLTRQLTMLGNKVDTMRGIDKKSGSGEMSSPAATQDEDDLMREVHRLRHIHSMHEGAREMFQFLFSLVLLIVFWFVTGAIFQAIEGWTFGNAMYFSYVFFLTIGYGDYAPNTPAGKTLFVFWSMLAVPIMTNFVVQTIQTIVSRISTLLSNRARERKSEWYDYVATYFVPHTDLVDQIRQDIDNATEIEQEKDEMETEQPKYKTSDAANNKAAGNEKVSYTNSTVPSPPPTSSSIENVRNALMADENDTVTVSRADLIGALEQSILLEAECRSMLIDQMRTGSAQWLLLKADTNLQQQNNPLVNNVSRMQQHLSRKAELQKGKEQDATANKDGDDHAAVKELQNMSNQTMIERVDSYRQTYARFLVLAGRLLDLHGGQLFQWEREIESHGHHLGE